MCGARITILCKKTLFIGKLQCQRKEVNEQNHYAVLIVKRTAGCTENQDSSLWANQQHAYFFSEVHENIEYTITVVRCCSSNSSQGGLEMSCTLHFSL